ncbi:hypothetical protein ACFIOY_18500 [Bradyrhizobium sp. TZ2]
MTTQANTVHHVTTIARVAAELGEDDDWLRTSPTKWRSSTAFIWRLESEKMAAEAFSDFGIEHLIELVRMYEDNRTWFKRWPPE